MGKLKDTSFLEALAAAIQHETECFDLYLRSYESVDEGPIKDMFYDLAEGVDEHLKSIRDLYREITREQDLPNMKYYNVVHKFQSTKIQQMMRKLDRNKKHSPESGEGAAIDLALEEGRDAHKFYTSMAGKFSDNAEIKKLFLEMARLNQDRATLIEGCMVYAPGQDEDHYFWIRESLE